MSPLKKNPAQVLRSVGEWPVAFLHHNRPPFYMFFSTGQFEPLAHEMFPLSRRLAASGRACWVSCAMLLTFSWQGVNYSDLNIHH
jgi:hypothetical protein